MMYRIVFLVCFFSLVANLQLLAADMPVEHVLSLPESESNPRNSEGDFVQLNDGRILFVYSHFTGGAGDHARAHLASRVSKDQGRTWSKQDEVVLENEGDMNLMSVSLLRLQDKRLALFYVRKNSLQDCRPMMRISTDEAKTWGEPVQIIPDAECDYYVVNNARIVQLTSGRLVVPTAQHHNPEDNFNYAAKMVCYYSDDAGKSWKRGNAAEYPVEAKANSVCQEPGVIELKDGSLMLYCRTDMGSQYMAYSKDGGESWSRLKSSQLICPVSPATIVRIPTTGDLLAIWNDHSQISPELKEKRTPLSAAIS